MVPNLSFFSSTSQTEPAPYALKEFLEKFPAKDFWRFFIERSRYDFRPALYRMLYEKVTGAPPLSADAIPFPIIKQTVEQLNLTVQDLYNFNNPEVDHLLNFRFYVSERRSEKVTDILNSIPPAWLDFEKSEPGYLRQVTDGFSFMLQNLNLRPLTNDFIKDLHRHCTTDVKNMLGGLQPGEFRQNTVSWAMTLLLDSLDGLAESIDYLKSTEMRYGHPGVLIRIAHGEDTEFIRSFVDQDPATLAKYFQDALEAGKTIYYRVNDGNITPDFLEIVTGKLIEDLENSLANASTERDKIKAIFTFLKYTVLHHPFTDGVGRTYSMNLLQYLLMRENLPPFIIPNSNVIPGISIDEMIEIYMKGRLEMQQILDDPSYLSSSAFNNDNFDTSELLEQAGSEQREYFNSCEAIWIEGTRRCLEELKSEQLSASNSLASTSGRSF